MDTAIIPSPETDYLELGRVKQGRLFRKHILTRGILIHPKTGERLAVDDEFVARLTKNFRDGVCDIVQFPLADKENQHSEDPERNRGEVVDLQASGDKVYAVIDVRDEATADKLGKTVLGASGMISLDYLDSRSGQKVGPTLLHVAATNRPYVTGLEDYEEVVAATADSSGETVLLMAEEPKMTLEELLATLKDEHSIDVPGLQGQIGELEGKVAEAEGKIVEAEGKVAETVGATQLTSALVDALKATGVVKLSAAEQVTGEDIVGAVAELAKTNVSLTVRVDGLEKERAADAVDRLVGSGHVLPAQRDAMVELKLTNPSMFDKIVPAEPVVKLSKEEGVDPPDDESKQDEIDREIARLTSPGGPASAYIGSQG